MATAETVLRRLVLRLAMIGQAIEQEAQTWPTEGPSNCLIWALQQRATHGGGLILQPSQYGLWEHVQWRRPDGQVFEFDPVEPKYRHDQPPTFFKGRVIACGCD